MATIAKMETMAQTVPLFFGLFCYHCVVIFRITSLNWYCSIYAGIHM